MKHQIAFIGGQLLPIFIGIKEFFPNKIHLIVSAESKDKVALIKSHLSGMSITEHVCDAFDFNAIKYTCEMIIAAIDSNHEIVFNITGGTKVMVLAAQAIIQEKKLHGFYINPNNSILQIPSYRTKDIHVNLSTKEFIELSGHSLSASKNVQDILMEDFNAAQQITLFANNGDGSFDAISKHFRTTYLDNGKSVPTSGDVAINGNIKITWDNKNITVLKGKKELLSASSNIIRLLYFYGGWWELAVAKEVSKWGKPTEIMVSCELPFKGDQKTLKNEIDILINLGKKLIFIECKSGNIKQEDVNKMKIIKDTYGGLISKSILVSRYHPPQNIIEKCKELGIEVLSIYENGVLINPLSSLTSMLDVLVNKLSI